MAWSQTDIDTLKAAIASGSIVKQITFADQTMTFRSVDEMMTLLAIMQREATGGSGTRYVAVSKGA